MAVSGASDQTSPCDMRADAMQATSVIPAETRTIRTLATRRKVNIFTGPFRDVSTRVLLPLYLTHYGQSMNKI